VEIRIRDNGISIPAEVKEKHGIYNSLATGKQSARQEARSDVSVLGRMSRRCSASSSGETCTRNVS
jgi:hypothetical protein